VGKIRDETPNRQQVEGSAAAGDRGTLGLRIDQYGVTDKIGTKFMLGIMLTAAATDLPAILEADQLRRRQLAAIRVRQPGSKSQIGKLPFWQLGDFKNTAGWSGGAYQHDLWLTTTLSTASLKQ